MFFLSNSSISLLESYSRETLVYVYREAAFGYSCHGTANSERWRGQLQSWPGQEDTEEIDEAWFISTMTAQIFLILYVYLPIIKANVYLCGQDKIAKTYYLERMKSLLQCFVHYYLFLFKNTKKKWVGLATEWLRIAIAIYTTSRQLNNYTASHLMT